MTKKMIFRVGDGLPGPRIGKLKNEKEVIIKDLLKKIPKKPLIYNFLTPGMERKINPITPKLKNEKEVIIKDLLKKIPKKPLITPGMERKINPITPKKIAAKKYYA